MWRSILWIMIGSMLGGVCRYSLQRVFSSDEISFPWVIFFVNVFGCFMIGSISSFLKVTHPSYQETINHVLIIGFCGSFTTFSTFSKQSLELIEKGHFTTALSYMILSLCLGILFVFFGIKLGVMLAS